jgi:hypothetical protein
MGEVEVVNPLSGDGKLYRDKNLKLKSEKEEEKFLILKSQNKDKILVKILKILWRSIVTACAGSAVKNFKILKNGSILIQTKNTEQAKKLVMLVNIAGLYEVRITECEETKEQKSKKNVEEQKLRDSGSRQKMASTISWMSEGRNSETRAIDSEATRKFREKISSELAHATKKRGKVGTYFLMFVKSEPPDHEREKPVVTAKAPNKLLPFLERRRQVKTANGRPQGRLSR